ncbi:MAG: epoxyqueuosine reductase [Chloroflexi bacterium]|nr:epoxyqueuosine reductase [Chloroflexota bacterium]
MNLTDDPRPWLDGLIQELCAGPENNLGNGTAEPAWGRPLVGDCRGDDPLFEQYKEVVGPYHWTPWEIFTRTFPETDARPQDLTVISWVLPQTEATKADNRLQTALPAERWARTRIYGEAFNVHLRERLVARLMEAGYPAVAPQLSPDWQSRESERYVYASTWSERHAAYAAGLGTFGLCDGLITPAGKAMRVGSAVARIAAPSSPRPYTDHHAYCLFYAQGTCGECIGRCPAGAITEAGHDKLKCREYVSTTRVYVESAFGFKGYGCGLCQTRVPCESGIPGR